MDQLTVAISDNVSTEHGGSPRLGSVWNRDGQRYSPDASTMRKSLSSGLSTPTAEVNKRRAAAEFIKQCTGLDVPYSSDLNFRQALRDGVVLCETLNKVLPNAVKIDSQDETGLSNVQAFLTYICETMRFPSEARFSPQDLHSEDYDDRPRIADCILFLKKIHTGQESLPASASVAFLMRDSDVHAVRDSPRKGQPSADLTALAQQQKQVATNGTRAMAAIQPNANLAVLYNDISKSLMSRLAPGPQPAAPKYDTIVSNVMEQFLNGLTIEYERRLLAKDQELNSSKEALTRLTKEMEWLHSQLNSISGELEEQKRKEVDRMAVASQQRLEQLEEELAQVRAALDDRTQALAEAEAALGSHDSVRSQREAALEAQLAEAMQDREAFAALRQRFNDLREENKRLYNTIQDLKGSIRVFCRVRPVGTTGDPSSSCLDVGTDGELAVYDKTGERKVFKFDRIFGGDSTQEMVYEDVQALIRSVMDGFNVCIFAYGQTGSGKTHTMTGSQTEDVQQRGINYRALDDLFSLQDQRQADVAYEIKAQMLEIYNETIRDLLTDDQGSDNQLQLLSTQPSGLNVPNAIQIPVGNTTDVVSMMRVGARNRHCAGTKMNERSSRSHQVLTIIVDGVNLATGARSHACLHLVDLAGSERTAKSGVDGDRLREANAINTSLTALGNVMHSLASKSKHIPFRNSKLTELLADSLSGQAKVCMLMHVAPESTSHGETVTTLNFGNRVASVTLGQAKCNVESGKVFEAHEALGKKDRAIADLREQLALAREQGAASQRQLQEQAALIQSLRAQVLALGGDTGPPSNERTDSIRTSNSYGGDSAASTPVSSLRIARPSTTTPRNQGAFGQFAEHTLPSQTPRSATHRSTPPLTLNGIGRSAASVTPRSGGLHASASRPDSSSNLTEQQDRITPLLTARGSRGQQQQPGASSSGVAPAAKPGGAPVSRLPPTIPRLDTLGAARASGAAPSGSMSARPSSRHAGSSVNNAAATSPTMAAAQRRSAGSSSNLTRPATSRAGTVYGSTGSLNSAMSFSSSGAAAPEPAVARGAKPPQSSRTSSGWK